MSRLSTRAILRELLAAVDSLVYNAGNPTNDGDAEHIHHCLTSPHSWITTARKTAQERLDEGVTPRELDAAVDSICGDGTAETMRAVDSVRRVVSGDES